ncbi:L-serine ammonia-lyase, iron-sulfur-dependent, subunit alpha [Criibacterium bergeronii]|uniref:Serine dehydratase subunit alpha family protein n=1 Tax=Criibacterium bergeronii TaxID=1871336 RepID=A0A371IJQ0_9FIRM|nr:L-serine ammonia-lyase, iron-sulfur-dependent, subunit alpha [Criibacterium bergeronii]MBS6063709.1 serine dehydratase subunit alpha family protein [Peptostreptococcaceae bacterium]RDY20696.1 serine dehydratase subunit alpha family protein [Criibacterium bergeronii]
MISKGIVEVSYTDNSPSVYVKIKIKTDRDEVETILSDSHTNIKSVVINGQQVYNSKENNELELRNKEVQNLNIKHLRQTMEEEESEKEKKFDIKDLSFKQLRQIIQDAEPEKTKFTLEGISVNKKAAKEGLNGYGSNLEKTLNSLKEKGVLPDNYITKARIMTAAAADLRMSGGDCPIMTSGGSGNQGIGVILPIAIVAKQENISDERLSKALFFSHAINRYVKEYSGKLSGICGCAIGAAIGATAGITWMIGGDDEQIAGACSNIFANLTGVICDGAKESCSMKLSTSAEESIVSAYLAVNGVISEKNVGIMAETIEYTIKNIGKLSHGAFDKVDDLMLEII